ncbi:MAG: hypothetical protein H6Q37_431 [Chloroflexi bacterium]|nr:hypothetical protein [Chloroflexota bacterium]
MIKKSDNQDVLDPQLKAYLDQLRPTPERDPGAAARGKADFTSEVDRLFGTPPQETPVTVFQLISAKLAALQMRNTLPTAITAIMAGIVILFILTGGAVITASAAQSALPGDALYPLKTRLEQSQTQLTSSASRQVTLHLQFAERRLDEVEQLIDEKRYSDIPLATYEYEAQIGNALNILRTVATENPDEASRLTAAIASELTRYSQALSNLATSVPAPVRADFDQALSVSQSGGNEEINTDGQYEITGLIQQVGLNSLVVYGRTIFLDSETVSPADLAVGHIVKVEAFHGSDGSLVARLITFVEPLFWDDRGNPIERINGNVNGNDANKSSDKSKTIGNTNDDEPAIQNNNRNTDEKSNENGRKDRNENKASNSNSNGNNGNDLNENSNENSNDNEQTGNYNQNSNLNQNENGNTDLNSNSNENEAEH